MSKASMKPLSALSIVTRTFVVVVRPTAVIVPLEVVIAVVP